MSKPLRTSCCIPSVGIWPDWLILEKACAKLKELELAFAEYAERRVKTVRVDIERRHNYDFVSRRAAQARAAYMILKHLQSCPICQTASKDFVSTRGGQE